MHPRKFTESPNINARSIQYLVLYARTMRR